MGPANRIVATPPLLSLRSVSAAYGRANVLRDVSVDVHAGQAVALLGSNGAGKTTTIRAIAGLLRHYGARITSGSIVVHGDDIAGRRSDQIARVGVAHVPEGRLIFSGMSVEENLRLGATVRRSKGADETMARMLELFPILKQRLHDAGGYLSGGEQQMLAISRALMADPTILLLDEVSLGLAPLITQRIFDVLDEIRNEFGTAMLVVEQSAKLALNHCERAYVMSSGSIAAHGSSQNLKSDPMIQSVYFGTAEPLVMAEDSLAVVRDDRGDRR